ncbi:antiviral reverse transcriptase Drt5 [Inquilinus sp.]|uniref:antiviral reverse transcriptase Drt5 n=1 Tax=Inquilinus sp. TaxID=1932117 RepID=UPI0031E07A7E
MKTASFTAKDFFLEDLPRTLFPLTTNKFLVEQGSEELLQFAERLIADNRSFLPQRRVHANKDAIHLRRTVKLDPVAEFYLYHLVYKNRMKFRRPRGDDRVHFGYRFEDGRPVSPSLSYSEFRYAVAEANIYSEEFLYFDISSYFNNIYHHDLHAWFSALKPADSNDVVAFGKFFRELNAGRSLDCLPHGLYPAKMIGNDFLRFIEDSSAIRAKKVLRFMDDIYLFGDRLAPLKADFAEAQRILGLKGLSVNGSKTRTDGMPLTDHADEQISELKKQLLRRRRRLIISHYDLEPSINKGNPPLNEREIKFILSLLQDGNLSEDDAELIMIVMRDNISRIEQHLHLFAKGFPHLAKNFYGLCFDAQNMDGVANIVRDVILSDEYMSEYQLFWFGMMLESYLMDSRYASDIVNSLYKHPSATDITRAKILEIPDHRYGLPEMREGYLREGRSDWLAWSSAVGSRGMDKQARNYLLAYFKNGSDMNDLIAQIIQKS